MYYQFLLYMNPGSQHANWGRFDSVLLQSSSASSGPWSTVSNNSIFSVHPGDSFQVVAVDSSSTITSAQVFAVFGRANSSGNQTVVSSPFFSSSNRVACYLPGVGGSPPSWPTAFWPVTGEVGN